MAITITSALRTTLADIIDDQVNTGGGTATIVIYAGSVGGTTLGTFNLSNPAFGGASTGVITLASVPKTATAAGTGTAGFFAMFNRGGTEILRGTVGLSAADIIIDNTSIVSGQSLSLDSFTVTVPAS